MIDGVTATYEVEVAEQLKRQHGLDMEEELSNIIAHENFERLYDGVTNRIANTLSVLSE